MGEGKLPPGVSQVQCHLKIKFQWLYPCFRGYAFQRSLCQPSLVIPLPRHSRWHRKPEVVLFWHVWLHMKDISVNNYVFMVGKLNAIIVIQTRIHLDVTF